jgi:hypothetical protein
MMWVRTTIRLEAEGEVQKKEQEFVSSQDETREILHSCQRFHGKAMNISPETPTAPQPFQVSMELYACRTASHRMDAWITR